MDGACQKAGSQPWALGEQTEHLQVSAWEQEVRYSPGEKKGPGKLVGIQGSPCPNLRKFHPSKWESKQGQQEAWMDEQGAPY